MTMKDPAEIPKGGWEFVVETDVESLERLHKVARHRQFEIHCDEPEVPLGGEDRYPQPLTYIAAGLGC
jgi:hypothetical protein